jgi:hypothetical protein
MPFPGIVHGPLTETTSGLTGEQIMAHAFGRGWPWRRVLTLAGMVLAAGSLLALLDRPTAAGEPARAAEPARAGARAANLGEMVKLINENLEAGWKANKVTPSARCDDYEFIRRATLDILGRIAKPEEIDAFLREPALTRRGRLIERLLEDKDGEYSRHWANMWANWLLTRSGAFGHGKYKEETQVWLEDQFAQNRPYDKLVTSLLTASGKNSENGAVNFILAHVGLPNPPARQAEEGGFEMVPLTSRITRLFLGVQTQCTQCHDHPFDKKMLQPHFWGINAYLRQVERVGTPPVLDGQGRMRVDGPTLELKDNPDWDPDALVFYETRSGKELQTKATFLDGTKISAREEDGQKRIISGIDRRVELADRVVAHPLFPKAYVNRVWAHFFGRGFTTPVDDFNDQNEPSNPELFNALAEKFNHYGYNQKELISWICNSNAYSLSCVANKTNDKPENEALFSRMLLKAQSPETLFESLMVASQSEAAKEKEGKKELRERWMNNLISNFGDDEGNEVVFNATVVQALLMMNGQDLNEAISPKEKDKGTVAVAFAKRKGNGALIIRDLYLASLNRPPTVRELQAISIALRAGGGGRDPLGTYQDIFWALLNSNEFILNH